MDGKNLNSGIELIVGDTGSTLHNETRMQQATDRLVQKDTAKERLRQYRNERLGKACGTAGIGLFFGGLLMLIMFAILIVKPAFNDTKLKTTQCKVIASALTDKETCDCSKTSRSGHKDCSSSYPCLQIKVAFIIDGEKHTGYLYKDSRYTSKKKCSIERCNPKEELNYAAVKEFCYDYGQIDDEYTCYYNPKSPDMAFATRTSVKSFKLTVMHCTLWPLLVSLIGIGMLTFYFRAKGQCCFRKMEWICCPITRPRPELNLPTAHCCVPRHYRLKDGLACPV